MNQPLRVETGLPFVVEIGGLSCRFFFDAGFSGDEFVRKLPEIWESYSHFQKSEKDTGTGYSCLITLKPPVSTGEFGESFLSVRENDETGSIECLSVFRLTLSPDHRIQAGLELHPRDPVTSFSHGLRVMFAFLGAWNGAVLLHSAALTHPDGRGFIFPGRSGSGKTTLASLCPGFNVVGDDLIFVTREKGEFQVWGTPFNNLRSSGEAASPPPLSAVLFPNHGRSGHRVQKVSESNALALLLGCAPSAVLHPSTCGKICDILIDMVSSVRTEKLFFLPDSSIEGFLHGYSR